MKIISSKAAVLCLLAFSAVSTTHANENIIYGGIGPAKSNSSYGTSDKNPFSLGFIRTSEVHNVILGLDFSKEGTLLDSTYGQNQAIKQGMSFNLLLGGNLIRTESGRFDAAVLLGARQKTIDCPSSYLGYQCYANAEPDTNYGFNYGAMLTWSFKSVMVGIRATGASTQALVGFSF